MLLVSAVLLLSALGAQPLGGTWREAAEFLPLFAPAGPAATAYRIYVSTLSLGEVLRALDGEPTLARGPRAWKPHSPLPVDAFGQAGRYDRLKLRRVYGARRPLLARGARVRTGRVVESWTLISPYPDPNLRHLTDGTLLIVLHVS